MRAPACPSCPLRRCRSHAFNAAGRRVLGVNCPNQEAAIAKIRCGAQTEPQLAPTPSHEHGARAAHACAGRASARPSLDAFTRHVEHGRFASKNPTSQCTARKGRNARREPRHALASMPPHASTSARTTRGAASAYGSARVARTSRARDRARSTTTRSTLEERRGRFGRSFLRPRVRLVCLVLKPCERAASDARKRVRRAVARGERHAKTRQNAPVARINFARRVLRITSNFCVQRVGSARGIRKMCVSTSAVRREHFVFGFVRGSPRLSVLPHRREFSGIFSSQIFQRLPVTPRRSHM